MNRAEKRHKYNADEVAVIKKIEYSRGLDFATKCLYASTLLILEDKFDFNSEQCQKFLDEVNKQTEAVLDGYVKYEDMRETILNDLGIDIITDRKAK